MGQHSVEPGIVLGAEDSMANKTLRVPALMEFLYSSIFLKHLQFIGSLNILALHGHSWYQWVMQVAVTNHKFPLLSED